MTIASPEPTDLYTPLASVVCLVAAGFDYLFAESYLKILNGTALASDIHLWQQDATDIRVFACTVTALISLFIVVRGLRKRA